MERSSSTRGLKIPFSARVQGAKGRGRGGQGVSAARYRPELGPQLAPPAGPRCAPPPARLAHAGKKRSRSLRTCRALFPSSPGARPCSRLLTCILIYSPTALPAKGNCHFPICQVRKHLREVEFLAQGPGAVDSDSSQGSPRTPTWNPFFVCFPYGVGGFRLKSQPTWPPASDSALSRRPARPHRAPQVQGCGRGRGARVGGAAPPPGYLSPVWSPRGRTLLFLPARASPPPPRSLPARPHPPPRARLARRQRPAGRGERGAGGARLCGAAPRPPPRIAQPAPPALPPPGCPSRVCRGRWSPDAGPKRPRRRASCCGRPASSPQHGFGFRRAERGRARDRRRYRGAAAAQPGGPGPGGGEAGAGNREYFSELPGGRPIPSRPGPGIAPRGEFAVRFSTALGRAGGRRGASAGGSPRSYVLRRARVARAGWGWGRVREIRVL